MEKEDILIEFARRLDDLNITEGEVRPVMMGVVERFLDEGTWQSLDEEAVVNLLFEGIALYGLTNWEPMARVISPVYLHAMEHVSVDGRLNLEAWIREEIKAGRSSANGLMPFLFLETEVAVVSTAVLDFAMIPKPPEDDPIGWPRRLVSDLEAGMGGSKGAILGGLVAVGDQRVIDLLQEVKWLLSDREVDVAVMCTTGSPTVAAFEFWLSWSEELCEGGLDSTGLFGSVASGLARLVATRQAETFADVERCFGYVFSSAEDALPMIVRGDYSPSDMADRYGDRLYALEAAESPPKLMSDVLRHLGCEPRAPLDERYTMQ